MIKVEKGKITAEEINENKQEKIELSKKLFEQLTGVYLNSFSLEKLLDLLSSNKAFKKEFFKTIPHLKNSGLPNNFKKCIDEAVKAFSEALENPMSRGYMEAFHSTEPEFLSGEDSMMENYKNSLQQ